MESVLLSQLFSLVSFVHFKGVLYVLQRNKLNNSKLMYRHFKGVG